MNKHFFTAMLCMISGIVQAQTPELVKDIFSATNNASEPVYVANIGAITIFSANDGLHGRELWRTDGTTAGTFILKDIFEGPGNSVSLNQGKHYVENVNGTIYFGATNGTNHGLYKTDGTVAGTQLVSNEPGVSNVGGAASTHIGNILIFSAWASNVRNELWRSDGTPGGTFRVKTICPTCSQGSSPNNFVALGNTAYFAATDLENGREIWKTDGTEAGTVLVKNINPGNTNGNPMGLVAFNDFIYFSANDGVNGTELWKTNGTEPGTEMVKDIRPGAGNFEMFNTPVVAGNNLFFTANNGTIGIELWKTDGTAAETDLVKDIRVGPTNSSISNMIAFGNTLFFTANNGTNGVELWKSNGTEAGTQLVKDINPGTAFASPLGLCVFQDLLYFSASVAGNGLSLWRSNGTEAGTEQVANNITGGAQTLDNIWAGANTLFFGFRAAGSAIHTEPWKTNGTPDGTVLIKDINITNNGSDPDFFTAMGNTLFFVANDGINGNTLWKSNGTPGGTVMVKTPGTGTIPIDPKELTTVGNTLFFNAKIAGNNQELWKTDGTSEGTVVVKDIFVGTTGSEPGNLCNVNGILFFRARTSAAGIELWKSDGTEAGTVLVKDIRPGSNPSSPNFLTNVNGTVFFSATDADNDLELWKSDGTNEGTVRVKDINPGAQINGSSPSNFINYNGTLCFRARNGASANGYELWKSNGTEAGTIMVKDIFLGTTNSDPGNFHVHDKILYFSAFGPVAAIELWRTDGTEAGTYMVKDIFPGGNPSRPANLSSLGNKLIFSANNGPTGIEPWISDGTEAGTVLLKDIYVGNSGTSSTPGPFVQGGGFAWFAANGGTYVGGPGIELYKTDGTAAGTDLVMDINPGIVPSSPNNLVLVNNTLFFAAETAANGRELWKVALGAAPALFTWTGAVCTAWENPANWSGNAVPGAGSDVVIPSQRPRYPVINTSTAVRKLTCSNGTFVTVQPGVVLQVLQ